jgi:hypothetical protein
MVVTYEFFPTPSHLRYPLKIFSNIAHSKDIGLFYCSLSLKQWFVNLIPLMMPPCEHFSLHLVSLGVHVAHFSAIEHYDRLTLCRDFRDIG